MIKVRGKQGVEEITKVKDLDGKVGQVGVHDAVIEIKESVNNIEGELHSVLQEIEDKELYEVMLHSLRNAQGLRHFVITEIVKTKMEESLKQVENVIELKPDGCKYQVVPEGEGTVVISIQEGGVKAEERMQDMKEIEGQVCLSDGKMVIKDGKLYLEYELEGGNKYIEIKERGVERVIEVFETNFESYDSKSILGTLIAEEVIGSMSKFLKGEEEVGQIEKVKATLIEVAGAIQVIEMLGLVKEGFKEEQLESLRRLQVFIKS